MSAKRKWMLAAAVLLSNLWMPQTAFALDIGDMSTTISDLLSNGSGSNNTINTFLLLTLLSLLPVLLIMMTSFTRIIMVLSFVRSSLGTQQNPPNQVLIGLALFLTFFIMKPVYTDIYQQAIEPFDRQEITQAEVFDRSERRIKEFMMLQTREKDIQLFAEASGAKEKYASSDDVPLTVMVPAFIISELRTAFSIGFLIFIPFLIIDLVVSSILMSMGMMMLSPIMISLPFKILLFVLVDGWYLVVESLIKSFQ